MVGSYRCMSRFSRSRTSNVCIQSPLKNSVGPYWGSVSVPTASGVLGEGDEEGGEDDGAAVPVGARSSQKKLEKSQRSAGQSTSAMNAAQGTGSSSKMQ